jgi:hypothetical protein
MEEALKLIIGRSSLAMREAIDCLRAISARSPIVAQRYANALSLALNDPEAQFTPEERQILADAYQTPGGRGGHMLRIRLSEQEHTVLVERSEAVGETMSDYARKRIFGE